MATEKSPFEGRRMSINKLGEVMGYLLKYNRSIWLKMCKDSEVVLMEGNVVMGPHPNWKAYKILCQILTFEQVKEENRLKAEAAVKALGPNLFAIA